MDSPETIADLQRAVESLVGKYREAQQRIAVLEDANDHQRDELIRTHAELADLQLKYKQLQTAHALVADSPERLQAKRQISGIIHKVDQALELLKE